MRLYYHNSYIRQFEAQIVGIEGLNVFLDATSFYPTSGGQPQDLGAINDIGVTAVEELEDGRIAHTMASPSASGLAVCTIDWKRRFDHMQQHTGQHLLSAVFFDLFGFQTVSFHMGAEVSTIDLAVASLTQQQIEKAEYRANEAICENREVTVSFEHAAVAESLHEKANCVSSPSQDWTVPPAVEPTSAPPAKSARSRSASSTRSAATSALSSRVANAPSRERGATSMR